MARVLEIIERKPVIDIELSEKTGTIIPNLKGEIVFEKVNFSY